MKEKPVGWKGTVELKTRKELEIAPVSKLTLLKAVVTDNIIMKSDCIISHLDVKCLRSGFFNPLCTVWP